MIHHSFSLVKSLLRYSVSFEHANHLQSPIKFFAAVEMSWIKTDQ